MIHINLSDTACAKELLQNYQLTKQEYTIAWYIISSDYFHVNQYEITIS